MTNKEYIHHLMDTFKEGGIVKSVIELELDFLRDRLKLATLIKVLKDINEVMVNRYGQEASVQYQVDRVDIQIEYLNSQRNIEKGFNWKDKLFYDLEEQVSWEVLERVAKERDL